MAARPPKRSEVLNDVDRSLRALSAAAVHFHSAIAENLGLTVRDHKTLDLIAREKPVTAGRLAELTGLTSGGVTAAVDRLEEAGYVRRIRDNADRRKVFIEPVPGLESSVRPLFRSIAKATAELCATYTAAELATIARFLKETANVTLAATKAASRGRRNETPRGPRRGRSRG